MFEILLVQQGEKWSEEMVVAQKPRGRPGSPPWRREEVTSKEMVERKSVDCGL